MGVMVATADMQQLDVPTVSDFRLFPNFCGHRRCNHVFQSGY